MKFRKCPLCNCIDYELIIKKNDKAIVKCRTCEFVYVANPSTQSSTLNENEDSIKKYTARFYFRHYEIKKKLDYFFKGKEDADVIEIGSGGGSLGKLLDGDTKYHYIGFEPSSSRAKYALNIGLNIINDYFSYDKISKKVDAIIIDNVLEHIHDPVTTVNEIGKSLKTGGIIIVIVPNLNDIRRFIPKWKKRHHWQPHCHVNYFKYGDLVKIFKNANIKIKPLEPSVRSSLRFLINAIPNKINLHLLGLYCYGVKR